MTRKFSTAVLDTLLKTVEVEFKVPLMGFGEIKFPVSEYAKEWWKNERAREDVQNAIEAAEQKFIIQHKDNKAAQILRDFSLKNEEEFQRVIAELLNHLDEQKITWLMAGKLGKGFENVVSNKDLLDALKSYIPILQDELGKIREFREVISYLLQKQIANTTSLTYETTKEIRNILLERQAGNSTNQPVLVKGIEKTVFISYRHTNFWTALAVFQNLNANDYDVFLDYKSIPGGDFEQVITENVKSRTHFIVILSPSALERCHEPADWLRREIEIAIETKRNIIPLMMEGFDFGSAASVNALTGKLADLKKYSSIGIPAEYFDEAMAKLRSDRFLNRSLESVLHPVSDITKQITAEQKSATHEAPPVKEKQLTAQIWFERGYVFEISQDLDEAIRCYSEAIRLDPELDNAYIHLGNALLIRKRFIEAELACRKATEISPSMQTYVNLGFVLDELNRYDEAEVAYRKAIELEPDEATTYSNLGVLLARMKRFDEAEITYGKAIELNPDFADTYYNRALLRERNKKFREAITDYTNYLKLSGEQKEIKEKIKELKRNVIKKIEK